MDRSGRRGVAPGPDSPEYAECTDMSTLQPDYHGTSIVNLMSSVIGGLGGTSPYPPLELLSAQTVAEAQNVVLLLLDGLGYEYLARYGQGTRLHAHLRGRMTSVFPSTTATAVTTFVTGAAPKQHAVSGWFMYLREVGAVCAILPFRLRAGGTALAGDGLDPARIIGQPPIFEALSVSSYVVTDDRIVDSDYSQATAGSARRLAYTSLYGYFERIVAAVKAKQRRKYVYAYWPAFDGLSHEHGIASPEVHQHLETLDAGFSRLLEDLTGTDTLVIATADHGLIDTARERTVYLDDHPAVARALTLPLCGEPRTAYCYVRPARAAAFRDYVRDELGHCCDLFTSEELVEAGYFGLFDAHPALEDRIGDYVLLMKDNYVIKDHVLGERGFSQIGVHGGLTPDELYVPLIVARV